MTHCLNKGVLRKLSGVFRLNDMHNERALRRGPAILTAAVTLAATAGISLAAPSEDQKLIEKAAASRTTPQVVEPRDVTNTPTAGTLPAARGTPSHPDAAPRNMATVADAVPSTGGADEDIEKLRTDAVLATSKLDIRLARQLLAKNKYEAAARKARRVLDLLQVTPLGETGGELELQAEGILAKAAKAGVNVDRLDAERAADDDTRDSARFQAQVREAARLGRSFEGSDTPEIDTRGDARAIRSRTIETQGREPLSDYDPGRAVFDREQLRAREEALRDYQSGLEEAVRLDEARRIVSADEARIVGDGWVTYPDNWPEITARRAKYRGGLIHRGPAHTGPDGREWYVGIYDLTDLSYVPPSDDMTTMDPVLTLQMGLDRAALRNQSMIFRGWPEDLAAGLPLLRFFGGLGDFRGYYSPERQAEVVRQIRSFMKEAGIDASGTRMDLIGP